MTFRSAYVAAQGGGYQGTLSYRDGHLAYDHFAPMSHNLEARFEATPSALTLNSARLSLAASTLHLQATVRNYASPVVDLKYDFAIETGEFRRILRNPDVPAGLVRIIGTAHYVYVPKRPMIETISAEGEVTSRSLLVRSSAVHSDVREATSRFQLRDGNLSFPELRLYVLGGELQGSASIQDVAGRQRGQINASLRGISIERLQAMMRSQALDASTARRRNRCRCQRKLDRQPARSGRRCKRKRSLIDRFTQPSASRGVTAHPGRGRHSRAVFGQNTADILGPEFAAYAANHA